jgi:hypothetical protein
MGSGQKPLQQLVSNLGQNFNTSAQAMVQQPGITSAGLGLGIPKGMLDVPVYLAGGANEAWNYLRGNTQPYGDRPLDKWEQGWRDTAINLGSLGQNTDKDRMEKERAAGASLTMTSMASPGLPLGAAGKVLKGGAAGIAGENLVKGITAASDYIAPAIGKASAPILDPMLKGAGKALVGAETQTAKVMAGESKEWTKMMANPKSPTNYIKARDPHVLATLSDKYQVPVAKLDDLGEPLANKFKNYKSIVEESKEKYTLKKDVIKQQLKVSGLSGNLKKQVKRELESGLKPPFKVVKVSQSGELGEQITGAFGDMSSGFGESVQRKIQEYVLRKHQENRKSSRVRPECP